MPTPNEQFQGIIKVSMPTLVTIEYDERTYLCFTQGKTEWKESKCTFYLDDDDNAVLITVDSPEDNTKDYTAVRIKNLSDFNSFQDYIHSLLKSIEPHEDSMDEQVIDLVKDLNHISKEDIDYQKLNNKSSFPNCETFHGLLNSLVESLQNTKANTEYFWGIWRNDETDTLITGYDNNHFLRSYHLPDTSERKAEYNTPPPNLKWPILRVKQKNKTFFLGKAAVQEIAQTSFVPHLPPTIQSEDSANRVLDRDISSNQWQRNADRIRIKKIQDFIEFDDNLIANTPMLFIARNECVTINEDFIEIHFDKFLKNKNNRFVDRESLGIDSNNNNTYEDYRPFWIIDGQHRIHGLNNSNKKTEELGIIVFDDSFDVSQTAKIFAEINTLQQKLPLLHEIFMAHRFKLSNNNPNRTFRDIYRISYEEAKLAGWGPEWHNSRANTYAYEIAALLCSKGELNGQIQFLPQNPLHTYMYSADQWIIYTRKWFTNNGIYGINHEEQTLSELDREINYTELIFIEINNFFKALSFTYRKELYSDNKSRWTNHSSNSKPLITKKSNFAILLELYPRIANKSRNLSRKESTEILTVDDFTKALKPISNVDWLDKSINDFYSGGGERPRRALQAWISDAIAYGKKYSSSEILNSNNKSKPGKGIMAKLERPLVKIESEGPYRLSSKINLTVKRPYNARYEGRLTIFNANSEEVENKKIVHNTELNNTIQLQVNLGDSYKAENKITVRIEYFNMHNVVSGYWSKEFPITHNT